ncbi:MAG: MBL fold metallo-hydrolase [Candidatus Thermoplasmatota archaeon]|jgi:glyoxylase-like metal-dependent hydrolase (beta-lactamase superfamily II)|nr:MBL fold metallo-hydrolase [Candidatus Thermoplasmatota archaeon]MDP7265038.1 MBL fold metallo-hydrolase [Candidatus Thermoplasmatota archaeon]
MPLKQIKTGLNNFSYVIYCSVSKKAAMVDPGFDGTGPLRFIDDNVLELVYIINTHHHGDHSAESETIRGETDAKIITSRVDSRMLTYDTNILVEDGDNIELGDIKLKFILTPGHTPGGICILVGNKALITGDTLFMGDCGRCDLEGGSLKDMFDSLNNKIKTLPDHLIVYPGHDYGELPFDELGRQKRTNKTLLAGSLEEFSKIP